MSDEMKLLMALCDALGFDVNTTQANEVVDESKHYNCNDVIRSGGILYYHTTRFKLTKKSPN